MPRAKTQTPGAYFSPERLRQYKSQPLFDDTASRRIYARDLYFCIPMRDSNNVNDCSSLVYSSKDHHLSVSAIHQALDDARHNGDEYGIVLIGKRIMFLHYILSRPETDLLSRVFHAQDQQPVKNDWSVQVKKDLEQIGLGEMSFQEIKSKSKEFRKTSFIIL